ncbi:MAG: alpha/beta fold hydrolase [Candidatus Melainabacteria bacterium]|nr:alpha/beta fold hydrolase [Candidatus Melainabacteria bacterium]
MKTFAGGKKAAILAGLVATLVAGMAPDANAKRVVENSVGSTIQLDPADLEEGAKTMGAAPIAPGQAKIPCMVWMDKQTPKAAMLCIHGFGLHKGTYDAFANEMAKQGIATYAIDVRGFGAWVKKGKDHIDFDGTMGDIGLALNEIRRLHPDLKIIVLGESMGGAIAMKAAQMYPEMVYGLISSVPAGDRFDKADSEMGVVKHVLLHGMNAPLDVGPAIVGRATKKDALKETWLNDPLSRTSVSANELIAFKNFMNSTYDMAPNIKKAKVLFIQGSNDRLVRPAGTYKLYNSLATPHREIVLSKTAEHLIFEDGQFNDQDLKFVSKWISSNIAPIGASVKVAKAPADKNGEKEVTTTVDGSKPSTDGASGGSTTDGSTKNEGKTDKNKTSVPVKIASANVPAAGIPAKNATNPANKTALSYWIELKRNGKIFRCNNKTTFKSGDAIKFHVMSEVDGYAYVVLQQGSTGSKAVLFPSKETGEHNYLRNKQDYPLPYDDWLSFDDHPGLEKVRIMFSKNQISMDKFQKRNEQTKIAYISPDLDGAKDMIGTRMQLSWDDSSPIIMPEEVKTTSAIASADNASQVRLVFDNPDGTLAVDVALLHQ